MIRSLASRITLAWGWKRLGAAFLAGGVAALAMPPLALLPALALSLPVLVFLIDGSAAGGRGFRSLWSAGVVGWFFGFGYHLAGLWWVGTAFLVEADRFAWALPIAVLALPAGLALFTAVGAVLARLLWAPGSARILALAIGLTTAEILRGHLFTGFPWNLYGTALTQYPWLAQGAAFVGVYGLTFLALVAGASFAVFGDPPDEGSRRIGWPAGAVLGLMCLALAGGWRLTSTPIGEVAGVRLRLVQPNIPQDEKFRPEARDQVMATYLSLSDRATSPDRMSIRDVTHLIWPESAFPFYLIRDREALAEIGALLPEGTTLITGAIRPDTPRLGRQDSRVFNSAYVIDHRGVIVDTYDKVHLVPFGEYLPFHDQLEAMGLEAITRIRGGFSAGTRRRTMDIPAGPPVGILICYETIFPGAATAPDRRPQWLLNLTNDAWFGLTPGPYQHLHQSLVRAIEEGLPMVRAANSGISAVIDPLGRTVASLALGTAGVLDTGLPRALPITVYGRTGDAPLWVILALGALMLLRRNSKNSLENR